MQSAEQIQQFIHECLRHRYDCRSASATFLLAKEFNVSKITNFRQSVEIELPENTGFQKYAYRCPQTRLYYTLYRNIRGSIEFIDYFERTIVTVRQQVNATDVKFKLSARQKLISADEIYTKSDEKSNLIWAVVPDDDDLFAVSSLIARLQEWRQNEYQIHPLTFFTTTDLAIKKKIDSLFSELKEIDSHGNLRPDSIHTPVFIWLAEVFIQLGWWKRLSDFFARFDIDDLAKTPKISLGLNRLNLFLQALAQSKNSALKIQRKNADSPKSFFMRYLLPATDDVRLDSDLQNFWEYLQIPALGFRWEREILENPDEFFAFVLLAIQRRFWWAPNAVDFVAVRLPESHKAVFELLTIISLGMHVSVEQKLAIIGSRVPLGDNDTQKSFPFGIVRHYTFGKQDFCEITVDQWQLYINLNKRVAFKLQLQEKKINLVPEILKPPLHAPEFRSIHIRFGSINIVFPLIWEQVTLKVNRSRFKFLRKKNRIQVTVKHHGTEPIYIEEQPLVVRNDRSAKFYLPLNKEQSKAVLQCFSLNGSRLTALSFAETIFTIRGVAFDIWGMLKSEFRVRFNGSRKNKGVLTNGWMPVPLSAPRHPVHLRLHAGKTAPVLLRLGKADDFWQAFKKMPAQQLMYELKCWYDESDSEFRPEALRIFFLKQLGWIPEMEGINIEKFKPGAQAFNLLLSSIHKIKDKKITEGNIVRIYQSRKSSNKKYFLIQANYRTKIFDFDFFIQEIEKK